MSASHTARDAASPAAQPLRLLTQGKWRKQRSPAASTNACPAHAAAAVGDRNGRRMRDSLSRARLAARGGDLLPASPE